MRGCNECIPVESAFKKACAVIGFGIPECQSPSGYEWSDSVLWILRMGCYYLRNCPDRGNNQETEADMRSPKTTPACYQCRTIAGFIQAQLNSYTTEMRIDDFIQNKICPQFSILEDRCRQFVQENGVTIM